MSELVSCQSKELLVSYLYDEATPEERRLVEAHFAECDSCRMEVSALGGVRESLAAWDAPALATHVRVVSDVAPPQRPRPTWWQVGSLAAAAVIVLAAAAGVANLELSYGPDGFSARTGWSRPVAAPTTPAAAVESMSGAAPWRAELTALERQLRRDLGGSAIQSVSAPAAAPVSLASTRGAPDAELLRRVQQLIDESEIRQQRNLALRMAEVSRDFNVQRQADLVQIQQGMGRLEGRTEAEAARAREMMNYIMRVSQQEPAR
ncbi:MAG: anti-sigma factor [Vicinamibacterales bacterium]